jgi:WhiB family transcriptional regulator, redox-sensing transcriptional regulator
VVPDDNHLRPVTELRTRPHRAPVAARFDADTAALQDLADGDDRMARRYCGCLRRGSPRPIGHTRQRVAPDLPCQQHDPELWFAEAPTDLEWAKALCSACPVRLTCLAVAVDRQEYAGVWGGQIFERGRIVPEKRARGRPRKHQVTRARRPLSQDEAVPTSRTSAPQDTAQNRVHAAVRRLHGAESALYAAHQSHVDAWITAAHEKLRDAVTEYLAATAA